MGGTDLKHNVYFEGKVQSLGLDTESGKATIGVIIRHQYIKRSLTSETKMYLLKKEGHQIE
ncbi:MAG: pyrimidine/purine nucleoside phosphorylase [Peptococcaceae bacterium]|nr:pyrimidine/purine nucleoside phosphorylase [Peptococcaceae bacterium]